MVAWSGSAAGLRLPCWAGKLRSQACAFSARTKEMVSLCTCNTRCVPAGGGGGRSRQLTAAALLCALLAAVTVAVEPPGQPAEASASDQSGGSQAPPATPTTSAAPATSVDPPAAPSRLSASLYGGSVHLTWDNPGDAAITKYQYKIRAVDTGTDYGKTWTDIPDSGASTVVYAIPVTGSERRNVRLRAVNAGGDGGYAVATTDAPAAPSRLSASLSGGSVSLSWDDPGDDSIGKYQYRIKTAGAGNTWSLWADIPNSGASTVSYTINGVTGSERRVVELQARPVSLLGWGATYQSAWASTGPPARPSGFTTPGGSFWPVDDYRVLDAAATSPKGTIVVSWSDPGDESIVKYQYRFRAQSLPGGNSQWIDIPGSGASTTRHTFVFPTPEMYRVRLRAVNSAGASGSPVVNVKPAWPALAVPSGLSASLSGSSISLTWDNPFDGSVEKYQYRIKTVGADNTWSNWTDIPNSDASTISYTISGVTGSERRVVQLRALRRSLGGPSGPASASTGPPARPSGFTTPGGSFSQQSGYRVLDAAATSPKGTIVVSWSDPGDDSIVKYQYRFRAQSLPGKNSLWIDIPGSGASTTRYTFVFPTPEMYRVRLRAVNSAGASDSQVVNVKPAWPALAVPSGLSASLSGGSVSLSWDNPFDGSVEKYQYRIKTVTGDTWSNWADIPSSDASTISYTISGVTGSERRVVQLRSLRRSLGNPSGPATASTG